MMMNSTTGKDYQAAKQEGESNGSKLYRRPSSQRQWTSLKNPRIVRVSRTFGGKDRHSKVFTVRGLRDRRIRLSVPTAIQLYDLQDRLGLSQPSKVVDWLIEATKHEIDKLPPLQIPQEHFSQFHPSMLLNFQDLNAPQSTLSPFFNANPSNMKSTRGTQSLLSFKDGIKFHDHVDEGNDLTVTERTKSWFQDASSKEKNKEPEQTGEIIGNYNIAAQNFFPEASQSAYQGFMNSNNVTYNPYYHWDIPNLSLSHYGSNGLSSSAQRDQDSSYHGHSVFPAASPLAPQSAGSQFCFHPTATMASSLIPSFPQVMTASTESNDPRQLNYLQLLSSNSQRISPNSLMPSLYLHRPPVKSSTVNANIPKSLHFLNDELKELN